MGLLSKQRQRNLGQRVSGAQGDERRNVAERPSPSPVCGARRPGGRRTVGGPRQSTAASSSANGRRSAVGALRTPKAGRGSPGRCGWLCGPCGASGVPPAAEAWRSSVRPFVHGPRAYARMGRSRRGRGRGRTVDELCTCYRVGTRNRKGGMRYRRVVGRG
jgi:hypothetical protein